MISKLLDSSKYVCMVHVTRNFMKSNDFCGNSARILCGFRKASVQLTTELQYYFCGECLRVFLE